VANKKLKNSAGDLLDSLGIKGSFQALIRRAVTQGWDMDEFAQALIRTKKFKQSFPGLVQNGTIAIDFTGGASAGASAVIQAVTNYRKGYDDFQEIASRIGYPGQVTKQIFGQTVRNGISPDEFSTRLNLVNNVNSNPGLLDMYNEQRKFAGLKPLDEMGLLKAAATNDPEFIDSYQAAYLRSQGLDLTAEQAGRVAKGIDSPLQQNMNLGQLVQQVRQVQRDAGPELRAIGVDDEYLTGLAAGNDPDNRAGALESIVASRRLMQRQVPGTYGRQTDTGGFALYPEEETASY
jgi:hypothetical protein